MAFIPHTRLPPGRPGEPFIIPYLEGDVVEFPAGESVVRMLVTGKETNNTFALVEADGSGIVKGPQEAHAPVTDTARNPAHHLPLPR